MFTTGKLKTVVADHFDRCEPGHGQFIFGEWFMPKHQDSLQYLLETLLEGKLIQPVGGNS